MDYAVNYIPTVELIERTASLYGARRECERYFDELEFRYGDGPQLNGARRRLRIIADDIDKAKRELQMRGVLDSCWYE